eukprot:6196172-Pleurochrysis_carterae.AAC.1
MRGVGTLGSCTPESIERVRAASPPTPEQPPKPCIPSMPIQCLSVALMLVAAARLLLALDIGSILLRRNLAYCITGRTATIYNYEYIKPKFDFNPSS